MTYTNQTQPVDSIVRYTDEEKEIINRIARGTLDSLFALSKENLPHTIEAQKFIDINLSFAVSIVGNIITYVKTNFEAEGMTVDEFEVTDLVCESIKRSFSKMKLN